MQVREQIVTTLLYEPNIPLVDIVNVLTSQQWVVYFYLRLCLRITLLPSKLKKILNRYASTYFSLWFQFAELILLQTIMSQHLLLLVSHDARLLDSLCHNTHCFFLFLYHTCSILYCMNLTIKPYVKSYYLGAVTHYYFRVRKSHNAWQTFHISWKAIYDDLTVSETAKRSWQLYYMNQSRP